MSLVLFKLPIPPRLSLGTFVGNVQLPDFQRGWVWDDDHIPSLLASVSLSFPIGAVMMLQTGNPDVRFKPRLVEGLTLASPPEPERLILDGQQRLTSLFLALLSDSRSPHVIEETIESSVVLPHIAKAHEPNGDREEAIVGIPKTGKSQLPQRGDRDLH